MKGFRKKQKEMRKTSTCFSNGISGGIFHPTLMIIIQEMPHWYFFFSFCTFEKMILSLTLAKVSYDDVNADDNDDGNDDDLQSAKAAASEIFF